MRLVERVRGFVRLGRRDQFRLMVAWSLLGLTRLFILCVPFRVVRRLLGEHTPVPGSPAPGAGTSAALTSVQAARAARIGLIVQVAARHTPWRSECYPQALTARILLGLRRIPHRTSFGLRRDGGELVAHAWVTAGVAPGGGPGGGPRGGAEVCVVGGDGRDYTEVGSFLWSPARSHRSRA